MCAYIGLCHATFSGETELYEDDGNSTQYMNDTYTKTVFSFGHESANVSVCISNNVTTTKLMYTSVMTILIFL